MISQTDSLIENSNNLVCIFAKFQKELKFPHEIVFFNPKLFDDLVDSSEIKYPPIICSNVRNKADSSLFRFEPYKIVELSDTMKIGIISLVTPDFPHLFPKSSEQFSFRLNIFDCAKEVIAELIKQNVNFIIANNFLGKYLSKELSLRIPEIDFTVDSFEKIPEQYIRKTYNNRGILLLNYDKFSWLEFVVDIHQDK